MNVKVEVVEVVLLCYFIKKDRKNNNLNVFLSVFYRFFNFLSF